MLSAMLGRAAFAAAVAAVAASVSLEAQDAPSLQPGARVRVFAPSLPTSGLVGTVVGLSRETLTLEAAKAPVSFVLARSELTRIEVSTGQRTHVRRDMGIGLLIGATGGAIAGRASGDDKGSWFGMTSWEKARIGAVVFGVAGALAGALVAGNTSTEEWKLVPLRSGSRVSLAPRSDGRVALTYSVTF